MKRIILKINKNGSVEPFTQLPKLFEAHPFLKAHKNAIERSLSVKKEPFKKFEKEFVITRQIANSKEEKFS